MSPSSKVVNCNAVQPSQQINWQHPSNMQQAGLSQQPGANTQPNSVSDIFSALHNVRFSFQPTNPSSCGYEQPSTGSANTKNAQESPKPSFSFQYLPGAPQNVMTSAVPLQFGQSQSLQGPAYFVQNPTPMAQIPQTSSGQNIPIVFTMVPQPAAAAQSIAYTLQPQTSSRSSSQPKTQIAQGPNMSDNPMAMLMSQLSSSGSPDMSSFLPMLMNSKQEKSGGGMKALLPLILNMLNNDRGCSCPHCGCPCNNEPTVHGGYSSLMNYSKDLKGGLTTNKNEDIEESGEVEIVKVPKKIKTKVRKEVSEEVVEDEDDEDDDYEDDEE